jgi:hypothetical protein
MTTALKPGESGGGFPYFLWFVYMLGTHPYACTAIVMTCVAVVGTVVMVHRRRKERKISNPTT